MERIRIDIPKDEVAIFCRQHHISKLSLFGSILTDRFRPDSDIDVLVEFEQGHTPTYLKLARIERELSNIMGGRRIDLRTPQEISRFFRDDVLETARVQYAAS